MATLTRQEMADILRDGKRSVLYNGRIIRNISQIPSEAELAAGNPQEEKKVQDNILVEMERLKAELAKLKASEPEDKSTKVRKATEDKSVPAVT